MNTNSSLAKLDVTDGPRAVIKAGSGQRLEVQLSLTCNIYDCLPLAVEAQKIRG